MNTVLIKNYPAPPFCDKEILRYAGVKGDVDERTLALLQESKDEIAEKLSYKVCYCVLPVKIQGDVCDFSAFSVSSKTLSNRLSGCEKAVVFAATLGVEIDRMLLKYGKIAPAKALFLQAIGAERIESLCNAFCADLPLAGARFSPGYGDLPLRTQKEIFALLDCERKIGLTLTDGLLMSPTKSVTAFVGLGHTMCEANGEKCRNCAKTDCSFRSEE